MTTISIVLLACTSKNVYMNINQYTEIINIGILMLCAGMVLYNANGEGLHDKLAHTRVINSDEKEYYMKKVLNKENKKVEEK